MGKPYFFLPPSVEEAVSLLNMTQRWTMTILRHEGRIYLYDGDQPMFMAETSEEALSFVAGCVLTTYSGDSLEGIRERLEAGEV